MAIFDSPLYLVIKLIAYCAWCFVGLRWFRPAVKLLVVKALAFGVVRLCMGLFFGIVIFFLGTFLIATIGTGLAQNVFAYLLIYVPVRWIEWSIMAPFVVAQAGSTSPWFLGWSTRDRYWRLGGICISCLADIPLIVSLGGILPTGRFLC